VLYNATSSPINPHALSDFPDQSSSTVQVAIRSQWVYKTKYNVDGTVE